jgi:hypothetical protein
VEKSERVTIEGTQNNVKRLGSRPTAIDGLCVESNLPTTESGMYILKCPHVPPSFDIISVESL